MKYLSILALISSCYILTAQGRSYEIIYQPPTEEKKVQFDKSDFTLDTFPSGTIRQGEHIFIGEYKPTKPMIDTTYERVLCEENGLAVFKTVRLERTISTFGLFYGRDKYRYLDSIDNCYHLIKIQLQEN